MATKNAWNNIISTGGTVTLNGSILNLGTDNSSNGINIGLGTTARTIQIGNSAAAHTVTLGSTNSGATTLIQCGNNGMTISNGLAVISIKGGGEVNMPLQSAFLGTLGSAQTNATGTGTAVTLGTGTPALTEIFDQNADFNTNGTFTAPITARYQLNASGFVTNTTIATTIDTSIVSSNRTYTSSDGRGAVNINIGAECCVLADMDAADTATVTVATSGEAADTNTISGTNNANTFSGFLAA